MLPPAALRPSLFFVGRWVFSPRTDWPGRRRRLELATATLMPPFGTKVGHEPVGGVPAERLTPRGATDEALLLYLHGGGYCTGSAKVSRSVAGALAAQLRCRAVVPDYRLAPEHAWPAQLDDARAAYEGLLAEGAEPGRILVVGDSAGAHQTLALALALRDAGRPLPAAIGLICPWLDLRPEALDTRPPAPREPFLNRGLIGAFARDTLQGGDPADPLASPVLADLRGLPPIVVHSSGDDYLAPDADALAAAAAQQGVAIEHRRFDGVWHDVHLYEDFLRLGTVSSMAASVGAHLSPS